MRETGRTRRQTGGTGGREESEVSSRRSSSGDGYVSKYEYKSRGNEAVTRRQKSESGESYLVGGYPILKLEKNRKVRVRFLPWADRTTDHYGIYLYYHTSIGEAYQKILCAKTTIAMSKVENLWVIVPDEFKSDECDICRDQALATKEGKKTVAKNLRWTKRVLTWVIVRGREDEGPMLYPCPIQADSRIADLSIDDITGDSLEIDRPGESDSGGFDVDITKVVTSEGGKKANTEYKPIVCCHTTLLSTDPKEADKWLDYVYKHPLTDCLKWFTQDHIRTIYEGGSYDEDKFSGDTKKDSPAVEQGDMEVNERTWGSIHSMRRREVEDIAVELKWTDAEIDGFEIEQLRDEVCKDLGLKEERPGRGGRSDGGVNLKRHRGRLSAGDLKDDDVPL